MSQDLYKEIILEELRHPQHKQALADPDVTIQETNASCGDAVTVFLKFDTTRTVVTQIGWQGSGCAISQAAMSLLADKITNMLVVQIKQLQQADIEELLGLEQPIAYGRVKCLKLGLQAIQKAIDTSFNN